MDASDHLREAFGSAAPEHFAWQTETPYVSDRERELVREAFEPLGERVLDLGCGEGATLHHLGGPAGAVGIDLFEDKVAFARQKLPRCEFFAGSVYDLPFEAGRFDHVLVRDVVHHLEEPERMLDECARVLASGGRIDVLEPCRYNPLILLHAIARKAERGELRSTLPFLTSLVAHRFEVTATRRYQAMPIHRLVLHPELGRPELGRAGRVADLLRGAERMAERLVPRWAWAYLHVRGLRRAN